MTRGWIQLRAPWALVVIIAIIIIAKTGLVPTASSGDDVWSGDTAYAFLKEGIFRTPMLSDATGRGEHDMASPPWVLVQAASIKLFGLTPFGLCAPVALCLLLMMLGIALLVRGVGGRKEWAVLSAAGMFGSFVVERGLSQGRPEPWTALALVFSAWSMLRGGRVMACFAGACLSVGGMAYLPQSPTFALAWLVMFVSAHGFDRAAWGWAALGAMPGSAAFFTWLGLHWQEFLRQTMSVGADRYLAWSNVWAPFGGLASHLGSQDWLQRVEWLVVFVVAGIIAWRFRHVRAVRTVALGSAVSSLSLFMLAMPRLTAPSVLMMALLFAFAFQDRSFVMRRLSQAMCVALVLAGILRVSLLGLTAAVQHQGRDYASVSTALRVAVADGGPVAIGKRAWLALREVMPPGDLDYLPYTYPSLPNTPLRAKRTDADTIYKHVVIERELVDTYASLYPWFKRAIDSGAWRVSTRVTAPVQPLPWDRLPAFDLLVYSRAEAPR